MSSSTRKSSFPIGPLAAITLVALSIGSVLMADAAARAGVAFVWLVSVAALMVTARNAEGHGLADREVVEQQKRYERLVENLTGYFVYRKDPAGRLLTVSDSVRRVLGFTRQEFEARHAESLRRVASQPASPAGPSTEATLLEVTLEDAHAQPHRIELSEEAVLDSEGRVIAIDGIARDATAEHRFREELRHAKDEAGAANMAKRSFLANMSHEIRTPLNAILGTSALALRSVREPRDREYLERIRNSARLLAEVMEDVLDLSRIEAGRLELANEPFELEGMLAEIRDVVGKKAEARGLRLVLEPQGSLPRRLSGDVVRLKQVLLNLLNNAVKFTERGEIVARIETVETRRDRVVLRFTVKDTGVGIAASHLGTLFEPFTQVDSSSTRRYGGMGVGLAISRRLVRLMAGEIEVTSEPGQGSIFSFTASFGLPEEAGEASAPSLTAEGSSSPVDVGDAARHASRGTAVPTRFAPGQSVLLVEDQAINRELARELLIQAGLTVKEAETGRAAIESLKTYRPDVVLMDVQMPDLDGLGAVALIRADPALRDLPVIAMTAHAMLGDRERFLAGGMSDYVSKPIEERRLFRALGRWLKAAADAPVTFAVTERIERPSFVRPGASPGASAGDAPTPSLDRAAGLRRAGGNQALYERLLRTLVADAPGFLARVRECAERNDETEVRRALHTLKGNAATVSAIEAATLAAVLEKTALEPKREFASRLAELAGSIDRVAAQLAAPSPLPRPAEVEARPLTNDRRLAALVHLRTLSDHVASGNLGARRSLAAVQSSLEGAHAGRMSTIEGFLARLDFTAAAPEIEALRAVLSSESSAGPSDSVPNSSIAPSSASSRLSSEEGS